MILYNSSKVENQLHHQLHAVQVPVVAHPSDRLSKLNSSDQKIAKTDPQH